MTVSYVCGDGEDRKKPSTAHYQWHYDKGEEACRRAKAEAAWYRAEAKAGRPLPEWAPRPYPPYVCGEADDRVRPNHSHYDWHQRRGEPKCGKSLAEYAWYMAEWKAGISLPNWKPKFFVKRKASP